MDGPGGRPRAPCRRAEAPRGRAQGGNPPGRRRHHLCLLSPCHATRVGLCWLLCRFIPLKGTEVMTGPRPQGLKAFRDSWGGSARLRARREVASARCRLSLC